MPNWPERLRNKFIEEVRWAVQMEAMTQPSANYAIKLINALAQPCQQEKGGELLSEVFRMLCAYRSFIKSGESLTAKDEQEFEALRLRVDQAESNPSGAASAGEWTNKIADEFRGALTPKQIGWLRDNILIPILSQSPAVEAWRDLGPDEAPRPHNGDRLLQFVGDKCYPFWQRRVSPERKT